MRNLNLLSNLKALPAFTIFLALLLICGIDGNAQVSLECDENEYRKLLEDGQSEFAARNYTLAIQIYSAARNLCKIEPEKMAETQRHLRQIYDKIADELKRGKGYAEEIEEARLKAAIAQNETELERTRYQQAKDSVEMLLTQLSRAIMAYQEATRSMDSAKVVIGGMEVDTRAKNRSDKSLRLASKSDNLPPTERLNLLAHAWALNPGDPNISTRLAAVFNVNCRNIVNQFAYQAVPNPSSVTSICNRGSIIYYSTEDGNVQYCDKDGKKYDIVNPPLERPAKDIDVNNPSGNLLVSSADKAFLFLRKSGKTIPFYHKAEVLSGKIHPFGEWVLTSTEENQAYLWNMQGEISAQYAHDNHSQGPQFSQDGKHLLTIRNTTVNLFELQEGRLDRNGIILDHTSQVIQAKFSPQASGVLTATASGEVIYWNIRGKKMDKFKVNSTITSLHLSKRGDLLVITSSDRKVYVYDLRQKKMLFNLDYEYPVVNSQFSNDDRLILVQSKQQVSVHDVRRLGQLFCKFTAPPEDLFQSSGINISPGPVEKNIYNNYVFTLSESGEIRRWHIFYPFLMRANANSTDITAFAVQPTFRNVPPANNHLALVGAKNGTVNILGIYRDKPVSQLLHKGEVSKVNFSSDGTLVLTSSAGGEGKIWSLKEGRLLANLIHDDAVKDIVMSADNKIILTASANLVATVWEMSSRNKLLELNHSSRLGAIAISKEGKKFITGTYDGEINLWDSKGQKIISANYGRTVRRTGFFENGNGFWYLDSNNRIYLFEDITTSLPVIRQLPANLNITDIDVEKQKVLILEPAGAFVYNFDGEIIFRMRMSKKNEKTEIIDAKFIPGTDEFKTVSNDGIIEWWYLADAVMQWIDKGNVAPLSSSLMTGFSINDVDRE